MDDCLKQKRYRKPYLGPREDGENVGPEPSFLPGRPLDEVDNVRSRDGEAVGVPRQLFCRGNLNHLVHVDRSLRHGFRL